MEPGDIVLFYGAHGLAKLISFFTKSRYYHVAIAINSRDLVEAVPRGVIRCSLHSRRNAKFVVIPPPTHSVGTAALKWAESRVGDGYDPGDLLAIAFDRIFAHLHLGYYSADRFTCGEFVATAFHKAGSHLFSDLDPADVVPADFARLLPKEARQQAK
jgi:uncharacterized protein YycO